ncbi:MAG: HAMP domain-containing histidine kinase [Clostridia bacterium]|nr:HAMP domain-containing histidine kinase [Clostridia bacterium]
MKPDLKKRFSVGKVSIQWKIFGYLLCFCVVLLVLLWLFQTVFLEAFYRYIKVQQVESAAKTVMSQMKGGLAKDLDSVSEKFDVCIEVLNSDGLPVMATKNFDDCILHRLPIREKLEIVKSVLDNGELSGYYNLPELMWNSDFKLDLHKPPMPYFSDNENLLYGQRVTASDGVVYIVLVNSVLTPVNATVEALRIQLLFVSLFMIAFSVLLAVVISKKVSRPIAKLNDSAKVFAKGKYDVTFDGEGFREISELSSSLNYAAVELSKVDRLRRDLIANISHDLRTPLTLIKGYSEAMRDLPDENNAENAQIIIDEAQRLSDLVNDALDLSKFQSGNHGLEVEDFDLTALLDEVALRFGKLVSADGYEVTAELTDSVTVSGDEMLISRVLYNLLINAMNYTGEDKKITVKQRLDGENVYVEVCDTGKGVAEDEIPYIWDKYYKAASDKHNSIEGTGLGLSIVKSVIELHKGSYGVESGESVGSIFWFSLPISKKTQNNA